MRPWEVLQGDVLDRLADLADASVQCVVTSPPYWGLRDYGVAGQIGLEATPAEFMAKMVAVFREVRRVLRSDGTCWVNMGDSYACGGNGGGGSFAKDGIRCAEPGSDKNVASRVGVRRYPIDLKPKDLVGMPWRLAFALQEDGWWLRQDIIWSKPNPMPESVTDRCTKAHEYIFLLTKSAKYYYDAEAVKEAAAGDPEASRNRFDTKDYLVPGQRPQKRLGRAAGNKSHKLVTEYESSDSEQHRTAAGLMKIADTPYGTRNKRSVWEIATEAFPEAHFATYPTKLVEPCILAGTSERGCCSKCGAPWGRQVSKSVAFASGSGRSGNAPEGKHAGGAQESSGEYDIRMGPVTSTQTTGWKPGCECAADVIPCTVLDPFNGAGTTGLVALRLGREYIGIELNPVYAEMAERRIVNDNPMFNQVEVLA